MRVQNPILETIEGAAAASGNSLPSKLVSSDSHVTEPGHCYSQYIDPAFRDRAPRLVKNDWGGDSFLIDGMPGLVHLGIVASAGKDPQEIRFGESRFEELHRGGWDGRARIADQDRDGIGAEVIYPSVGMMICNHADPDYKQACMWAYNRWLHEEFCVASPDRIIGLGQTAVRSVPEAIKDFVKFKEMGFKGVMLPGNPATDEDYDHASFDPLWEAAAALNLPVSFHILTSRADGANSMAANSAGGGAVVTSVRGPKQNAANALLKSIQDIIGVFIWGRVFERHPSLKVVAVEADAGWAPHFAYRMEHTYKRHRFWMKVADMPKSPREYFLGNIYMTFQDDWVALRLTGSLNSRNLLWANDFPHSDSTWPWSRELLRGQTAHLSDDEKNWIFRDNTAELYGISLT